KRPIGGRRKRIAGDALAVQGRSLAPRAEHLIDFMLDDTQRVVAAAVQRTRVVDRVRAAEGDDRIVGLAATSDEDADAAVAGRGTGKAQHAQKRAAGADIEGAVRIVAAR